MSKKNVFKIVLIIVNINKDENKSLISNQFSLKNDFPPLPPLEWYLSPNKNKDNGKKVCVQIFVPFNLN
jgi:hypothetical protein